MNDVRKQIEENRRNSAVQRMNETLVNTDQSGIGEVKPSSIEKVDPVFGEPFQKHVQNLNEGSSNAQGQKR